MRAGSAARPISGALRLTSPLLLTALSQRCLWLQAGSTIGQRLRAGHSQHRRQGRHGWAWVGLMVGARGRLCEAACAVETAVEKTRCRTRVTTFYSAHATSHAGCRGSTALQRSTASTASTALYSYTASTLYSTLHPASGALFALFARIRTEGPKVFTHVRTRSHMFTPFHTSSPM